MLLWPIAFCVVQGLLQSTAASPRVPKPTIDGKCSHALDCHLNGECVNGACRCDPMWSAAPNCSLVAFKPVPASTYGQAYNGFGSNESSWGGSTQYDPTDKLWHMFVEEMINNCGLETWHPNCRVAHLVSPNPDGPYKRVQVVMPTYSCGPSVGRDPVSGTWVLTHLGIGVKDTRPFPLPHVAGGSEHWCKNGNSYNTTNASRPKIPGGKDPDKIPQWAPALEPLMPYGSKYLLFADSPWGPWRNGTKAPNPGGNSVPLFLPNGSVLLSVQGASKSGPTNCTPGVCTNGSNFLNWIYADSAKDLEEGRYVRYGPENITVTPWTHWEDVFMYLDKRQRFHSLFHAVHERWENGTYSNATVGGHAFSEDGLRWHSFQWDAYTHEVLYEGGATWRMEERERPHLVFDSKGEPTHLLNGVCPFVAYEHINDHSFTQAVPLVTAGDRSSVLVV